MAKIFCMASAKGGSGKTILTASFATFLASIGKRVLIIDCDINTRGMTLLNFKEVLTEKEVRIHNGNKPAGIFDVETGAMPGIVKLASSVELIPVTFNFTYDEKVIVDEFSRNIKFVLFHLGKNYDYIFLDAQAGSDEYARVAMSKEVSSEVMIVSEYDPMSAAGVERLKTMLPEDLTYVRTWVLLNKMLPEFVKSFSDFMEVAKYLSPIPWDADVVRAYARRRVPLDLETGNEYTLGVIQTLKTLLDEDVNKEIVNWENTKSNYLRQPIESTYHDLETELEALMFESQQLENKKRVLTRAGVIAGLIALSIALTLSSKYLSVVWDSFELKLTMVTILVGSLGIVLTLFESLFRKKLEKQFPERAKIHRRQEYLEERLKKLEALRHADLGTLYNEKRQMK
jgi:MinD-like ATPase involved in chromosome partitioning or flagellar assembly